MTKIGIAGDWHTGIQWALPALHSMNKRDIKDIYHVGDFGIFSSKHSTSYRQTLNDYLAEHGMRIFVTLGNHENYAYIETLPADPTGLKWVESNIAIFPRGYRWQIDGKTFLSLGGAASIGYTSSKEGINWWPQEMITVEDIMKVAAEGHADVMITHDAPLGIKKIEELNAETEDDWLDVELAYAKKSQQMVTYAVEASSPQRLFHGHYHLGYVEDVIFRDIEGGGFSTRITGMAMNGFHRNLGILDVSSMEFVWVDERTEVQKQRFPEIST